LVTVADDEPDVTLTPESTPVTLPEFVTDKEPILMMLLLGDRCGIFGIGDVIGLAVHGLVNADVRVALHHRDRFHIAGPADPHDAGVFAVPDPFLAFRRHHDGAAVGGSVRAGLGLATATAARRAALALLPPRRTVIAKIDRSAIATDTFVVWVFIAAAEFKWRRFYACVADGKACPIKIVVIGSDPL
jgi:hypothetical protein